MILLVGDGIAPPADLIAALAEEPEPAVATVPDNEQHQEFERIDDQARWAGVAVVNAQMLASTATMLGDWDLQSTLLRRTLQDGALRIPVAAGGEPLLAHSGDELENFQRHLIAASRQARTDWVSRFVLPPVEEFATEQSLEAPIKPGWLIWAALGLTLGSAIAFYKGWLGAGLVMLVLSTPLDIIARRLASIRLRPLPAKMLTRRLLWPAAGVALLSLGYWEMRHAPGWGALITAIAAAAFAQAARGEARHGAVPGDLWVFSRRSAIFLAIPFAIAGTWTAYLVTMFVYAAASFFYLQNARRVAPELTAN